MSILFPRFSICVSNPIPPTSSWLKTSLGAANWNLAGRARGQCVTHLVYPTTSFGPLDQKPLKNWNLIRWKYLFCGKVGRGLAPALPFPTSCPPNFDLPALARGADKKHSSFPVSKKSNNITKPQIRQHSSSLQKCILVQEKCRVPAGTNRSLKKHPIFCNVYKKENDNMLKTQNIFW